MPSELSPRSSTSATSRDAPLRKGLFAAALMAVSGAVDAIGYLRLSGLYVANMSGNSVAIGLHGAQGDARKVLLSVSPVLAFMAGLLATALVLNWGARRHVRRRLAFVLIAEAVLLAAFAVLFDRPAAPFLLLVALGGVAMGLQNSALIHIGPLTLYTTHVTGLLTRTAHGVADALFWIADQRAEAGSWSAVLRRAIREPTVRMPAGLLALWLLYVVGAWVGAMLELRWDGASLWMPVAILLVLVAVDLASPIVP